MNKVQFLKITLRIAAFFLWYLSLLFLLIIWDVNASTPFLKKGTFVGDLIIRYPYQWDYELMFAGLFLVWGTFVWRASKNLQSNKTIIQFTAWGFLAHAMSMIVVGVIKTTDFAHLATDSTPWFIISFLVFYFARKEFAG